MAQNIALAHLGEQNAQQTLGVYRGSHCARRRMQYVFRVQARGNAIFLYHRRVGGGRDCDRTDFWVRRLLFRGFGGIFIPLRGVCVFAVDRRFDGSDCAFGGIYRRWRPREKGLVVVRETFYRFLADLFNLHGGNQYDGVLDFIFQGGLLDVFRQPYLYPRANLEYRLQYGAFVYRRARAKKRKGVENLRQLTKNENRENRQATA